jgi:hypothetical protein
MLGAAAGQSSTASDDRPTLADLAAKQKKAKAAKKVITNEDIPERPADNTSSNGSSSSGASSTSASASGSSAAADEKPGKGKAGAKGEKSADPEVVAAAQTKVDNLKHDEEAMTNGVKKIEGLIADGDDFRKNMMADTLQHQKDTLAETQKKRQGAESDLDKLKNPKKQ